MTKESFIIDRYVRGTGYDNTGARMYTLTQIKDGNLKVTPENSVDVVDAIGNKVETIERGTSGTFSASNAFFSFELLAQQTGSELKDATAVAKIKMPKWEEFVLKAGALTSVTLSQVPAGTAGAEIPFIYVMDGTTKETRRYAVAAAAAADKFSVDAETKTITLPTGLKAGDKVYVDYEYETANGFKLSKSAISKTKIHKFVALVLGHDICDPSTQYAAWQVFPKAKFTQDIDLTFAPDMEHPFNLELTQDYCDDEKTLFEFLFDGDDGKPTAGQS